MKETGKGRGKEKTGKGEREEEKRGNAKRKEGKRKESKRKGGEAAKSPGETRVGKGPDARTCARASPLQFLINNVLCSLDKFVCFLLHVLFAVNSEYTEWDFLKITIILNY